MKNINFDDHDTPRRWVRGREWNNYKGKDDLAPYIELIENGDIAVGCFTEEHIADAYDVESAIEETNGWAWWNVKTAKWVPLDTSTCKSLKEVCNMAAVLARMA